MAVWATELPERLSEDSGHGGKTLKYRDCGKVIKAKLPNSAPWHVVIDLAKTLIDSAEDQHHVFIEELRPCQKNSKVLWLETGS